MGCYDSLFIKCPRCGKTLEFQSKSGPCCLLRYNKSNLPAGVATDMNNNIILCQFCRYKWKFKLIGEYIAKFKLIKTNKKEDYDGNYNPKHPKSIKSRKELEKLFGNTIFKEKK